jgi:hypothetical protein
MIQNEETDSPIKGVAMTTEMANRILENSGRALIEELNGDLRNKILEAMRSVDMRFSWFDQDGVEHTTNFLYDAGHTIIILIPDDQSEFFEDGRLKEKYKDLPEPEKFGNEYGWTIAGHNVKGTLQAKYNEKEDLNVAQKLIMNDNKTNENDLRRELNATPLINPEKSDTQTIIDLHKIIQTYQNNYARNQLNYYLFTVNCNTFATALIQQSRLENAKVEWKNGWIDPGRGMASEIRIDFLNQPWGLIREE